MDFEKSVLALVKALDILECRGLDKAPSGIVAPSMVPAS